MRTGRIKRLAVLTLPAVALLPAAAAQAEVYKQSETGFVIRHAADVTAPPEEAWAALLRPAGWWSKQHTFSGDAANLAIDARAGGCFCEVLPSAISPRSAPRGSVEHMRVVYAEMPRALRMSGALGPLQSEAVTGTLTISLRPHEGGTRMMWEYVVGGYMRFKPEEIAPAVDGVLGEQVQWLALKLGTMPPRPAAPEAGTPGADSDSRPAETGR